ncbi:gamma-parvin-like isoform X2 [Xenopus laevis]|uniref:Gamma-parvin-like isoform X2 n=1 Tax=Xenopus laevis TaxID=8355 RepID=A0A8J1MJ41_XENLA|nr:gamma-parvin-like isoform X2 [Xenopus laevis]
MLNSVFSIAMILQFLIDWINGELKEEHIVVKSLEEDLYDGLVLHHLLKKIAGMKLEVEEIVLSANSQKRKLGIIMEAISQSLQLQETDLKWSINEIHNKDLLCTLHLIVALAQHFRPDLELPSNVAVEVIKVEAIMNEQAPGKPEPDTDGAGEPVC